MIKISACPICQSNKLNAFIQTAAQMHPSAEIFNFDQCSVCNLVFLNPRLESEKLMNFYSDFYLPYRGAEAWGKYASLVKSSQQKLDERRTKVLRKHCDIQPSTLIVDVGCGKPTFLKKCLQQFNCHVLGIDFSDEGWANAQNTLNTQNTHDNFEGIELMTGEVTNLPENLKADVITMWHYLEHDYQPLKSLKHLRKHAKSNTSLIIEVPNFESESRKKFGKYWAGWHSPRHLSLFSPNNIQLLLKESGWQTQALYTYGTLDAYLLYWMSRMEQKGMNWNKNMESEFIRFVLGMMAFMPIKWSEKKKSLGIMMVVAK